MDETRRTAKRWLTIMGGGCALVVLVMGVAVVGSKVSADREETRVRKAITVKQADALREHDNSLDQRVKLLREFGITQEKVAESKVDVCQFESRDAGWFAESYLQKCHVRTVQGYTTSKNSQEVRNVLLNAKYHDLFGESTAYPDCAVTRGRVQVSVFDAGNPRHCAPPSTTSYLNVANEVHTLESFDPSTIDYSTNIVWIEAQDTYWDEDLGCKKPQILFCDNPRDELIMAD